MDVAGHAFAFLHYGKLLFHVSTDEVHFHPVAPRNDYHDHNGQRDGAIVIVDQSYDQQRQSDEQGDRRRNDHSPFQFVQDHRNDVRHKGRGGRKPGQPSYRDGDGEQYHHPGHNINA